MLTRLDQTDVTGTIDMMDPIAITDAICDILGHRYPGFNETLVRQAFLDIEDAFWGRYSGLFPCDTPYHDLSHSLGTALHMARMVDGFESAHAAGTPALGVDEGTLAILLALYHDIGFLRLDTESGINGASLVGVHEQRSVDFMRHYLAQGPLSHFAYQADLIHATNFSKPLSETLAGLPRQLFVIGQMLGTADLVSQIANRCYMERCRHFLFHEFVIAGIDRTVAPSGETVILYASPEDLLRKTPHFYEHLAKRRLEGDFEHIYRYVAPHFNGDDPYARAMQQNLAYLNDLIARDDFSELRRKPVPLMPLPAEWNNNDAWSGSPGSVALANCQNRQGSPVSSPAKAPLPFRKQKP